MSKFEHAVQGAQWNQEEGIWDLEVRRPDGTTFTDRANVVIQAVGGLNNWKWPDIEVREGWRT
jgi:cation diffusion facilitator CzcD-associated flavoprotein CzcO